VVARVSLTVGVGQCTLDEPGELGAALRIVAQEIGVSSSFLTRIGIGVGSFFLKK
jgi:hypothetical protein